MMIIIIITITPFFTGWMPFRPTNSVKALKATSAFGLERRHWSSSQRCYLHRLRTLLNQSFLSLSFINIDGQSWSQLRGFNMMGWVVKVIKVISTCFLAFLYME